MLYTVYPLRGVTPAKAVDRIGPVSGVKRVRAVAPVQSSPSLDTPPKTSKPVYLGNMQALLSLRRPGRTEVDPDYIQKALERLGNAKQNPKLTDIDV